MVYMLFDNPADKQNMTFLNGNETAKIRQVYPSKKCNSTKEMLAACKDIIKKSADGDTIICWYDFMAVLCWWLCKVQFKNRKIIALNILLKDKATTKNKVAKLLYKPVLKSKKVQATVTSKKYGEHLNEMLRIHKRYTLLHDTYHGGYSIEYEGEVVPNSVFCGGRNGRDWEFLIKPTRGHKFSIGVSENGALVGVAICGRPVARRLDDGYTLEVNRLCTDGTPNACSILYAAAYRAARAMGYNKGITYKCIGHQIPEKLLKALIMDQLHLFIVQLCDKRKVLEELQKIEDVQNPVYRAKGEIMSLTDKVSQMAKKREQLYADYVAGVGAYTKEETKIMICCINKFETAEFVEIIHSIDPKAFVIADEGVSVMSGNFEKRL